MTKFRRKIFTFFLILSIFLTMSPGLFSPKRALAVDDTQPPQLGHFPISKAEGSSSSPSTLEFFVFANDDQALPDWSPALTVNAYYSNDKITWSSVPCFTVSPGAPLFKCILTDAISPSDVSPREFYYYIEAFDETNYFYLPSETPVQSIAEDNPFTVEIYNSPSWSNTISGGAGEWQGVKDKDNYAVLTTDVDAGATAIEVDDPFKFSNGDWIMVDSQNEQQERRQITNISDSTLTLNSALIRNHATGAKVYKFISDATVWVEGTSISTTTASDGTFILSNIPDGTFDVVAFKNNYCDIRKRGINLSGGVTEDIDFFLPSGNCKVDKGGVIWTAPEEGMKDAPRDISAQEGNIKYPILISFDKQLDDSTVSTDSVLLLKSQYNSSSDEIELVSSGITYHVLYDDGDPSNGQPFGIDFQSDPKIIIYTEPGTLLEPNTHYVVKLTSGIKDNDGNSLPDGEFLLSFVTEEEIMEGDIGSNFDKGGAYTPPFLLGVVPAPGEADVPQNTQIVLKFSQPIDSSTVSSTYLQLWQLSNSGQEISQISFSSITLDTLSKTIITLVPSSLDANTKYRLKILGGIKSTKGVGLTPPGEEQKVMFISEFETKTGDDTDSPQLLGASLWEYKNALGNIVDVPVSHTIELGFSEGLDPSTFNKNTVKLKIGTVEISSTVNYNPIKGTGYVVPSSALSPNSNYTLQLTSSITDLAGNHLSSLNITFKTGDTDSEPPKVNFANCDDYSCAITFSEPMNAAEATNPLNGETSVLNPKNYVLWVDDFAPWETPGNVVKYYGCDNLAGKNCSDLTKVDRLTFSYKPEKRTVVIKGFYLSSSEPVPGVNFNGGFRIWVQNVSDASGNQINENLDYNVPGSPAEANDTSYIKASNAAAGPISNSGDTFGMIEPGQEGMFGPPQQAGEFMVTDFGGKDPAEMGIKPIAVKPMNTVAGMKSRYYIDLPITNQIPANGKIVLTFPEGFNLDQVENGDVSGQFAHKDINGPGSGTVVIDTMTPETSGGLTNDGVTVEGQSVTILLGAQATGAPDFLHLELDNIVNSIIPKGTGTSGYSVDIKTLSSQDRVIETKTSMPFFIKPQGKFVLRGVFSSSGSGVNDLEVYLDSPLTGLFKTTTEYQYCGSGFENGCYVFSDLPAGKYHLNTKVPLVVGGTEYFPGMPLPLLIDETTTEDASGGTCDAGDSVCYYNIDFALTPVVGSPSITVEIVGTFNNDSVDIFAQGENGFNVKTVTLNGTYTSSSPYSTTFYLPTDGEYKVGIGPAMPQGPMHMGPPPMPDWLPPDKQTTTVSGSIPDPATLTFTVQDADKTITGHVRDASGNAVSNVFVKAYSPEGGFGTNCRTEQDGSFSLKVSEGIYKIGASLPGIPPSQEVAVEVRGGNVYLNGEATSDVILTLAKSNYTISGTIKIKDADTGQTTPVKDASVVGWKQGSTEHVENFTDASGQYVLYTGTGTWNIKVSVPGKGVVETKQITVSDASQSNVNFLIKESDYFTVEGRIFEDKNSNGLYDLGEGISLAHVSITNADYENYAVTDGFGVYHLDVPQGTYEIDAWEESYGDLPPKTNVSISGNVTAAGIGEAPKTADIMVPVMRTVTINFVDSEGNPVNVPKALIQLDKENTKGVSKDTVKENTNLVSLQVPAAAASGAENFILDFDLQGIAESDVQIEGVPGTTVTSTLVGGEKFYEVEVDGSESLNIVLPELYTISGQVKDSAGNPLGDAIVHIEKPDSGVEFDVQADSSGNYSFKASSSTEPYLIQANKAGYVDESPDSLTISSDISSQNIIAANSTHKITGTVYAGGSAVADAFVFGERLGGGFASTRTNTNGVYELVVTDGDWKVSAVTDGYTGETLSQIASVNGGDVSNVDLSLSGAVLLNEPKSASITPVSGGIFKDPDTQLDMTLPPASLSTEATSHQLTNKESSNIPYFSPSGEVIANKAEEIRVVDQSGIPLTNLNSEVMIDKTFTKAELVQSGIDSVSEVEKIRLSSFDETAQNWTDAPTTITYLDSNERAVIPNADLSNVDKVIFNGTSKHFSKIAVRDINPDSLAPSSPSGISVEDQHTKLVVSWTAPTTNRDGSPLTDLRGYNVYRATSSDGPWTKLNDSVISSSQTSYEDTNVVVGQTYYYRITADTGLESEFSSSSFGSPTELVTAGGAAPIIPPTLGEEEEGEQEEEQEEGEEEEEAEEGEEEIIGIEKPISEMTAAELRAEIVKIQKQIVQLLQQLIQIIQDKIAALSATA